MLSNDGRSRRAFPCPLYQGARELPLSIEYVCYRVAQEALTNVFKHAQAQRVEMVLTYGIAAVRLSICDDGQGFDAETRRASTSLGIDNMAARVAELGGDCHVQSAPGAQLAIRVPIQRVGCLLRAPHPNPKHSSGDNR
ncbi:MAG: ATP-binding protein [Chloroflexales bacterium]|nr:ATP-binding protein [Chloroflexales bacterium]